MTAATLIKRIATIRKEIARHDKEIARYEKEYCYKGAPEHMREEGDRWIRYYAGLNEKAESKIAEMSKKAAELATEEERKDMIKAMAEDMEKRGFKLDGYTTKGLHYSIFWNHGITERSKHCYSMIIEGRGTVFTSGTLETVAEYILNN